MKIIPIKKEDEEFKKEFIDQLEKSTGFVAVLWNGSEYKMMMTPLTSRALSMSANVINAEVMGRIFESAGETDD